MPRLTGRDSSSLLRVKMRQAAQRPVSDVMKKRRRFFSSAGESIN
jgi:hypothetical protein